MGPHRLSQRSHAAHQGLQLHYPWTEGLLSNSANVGMLAMSLEAPFKSPTLSTQAVSKRSGDIAAASSWAAKYCSQWSCACAT
eukprot:7659816-Pyramimonas_sp.AAC.1